jgi:hypothetical protein
MYGYIFYIYIDLFLSSLMHERIVFWETDTPLRCIWMRYIIMMLRNVIIPGNIINYVFWWLKMFVLYIFYFLNSNLESRNLFSYGRYIFRIVWEKFNHNWCINWTKNIPYCREKKKTSRLASSYFFFYFFCACEGVNHNCACSLGFLFITRMFWFLMPRCQAN